MDLTASGRRSEPRVEARVRVKFNQAGSFVEEYTRNISKAGVFIETIHPNSLGEKIEMSLFIPKGDRKILAIGEVIHIITPECANEKRAPGMGVHILDLKKEDENKLIEFICSILEKETKCVDRRERDRVETKILVEFKSQKRLTEEYISNISQGGLFITTTHPRKIGEKIGLILVHPETKDELLLHGEVTRVVSKEEAKSSNILPGMGIKFQEMGPFLEKQLDEFIQGISRGFRGSALVIEEC